MLGPMSAYATIPIAGGDTATPRNLAKRLALIARWVPVGGAVLDAGCGAGEYVAALGALGFDAHGVEYEASKVAAWARERPGDARVQRGDIARLPFPDGRFAAVLLNEVLEHVPDEERALAECRRVLMPGGVLILLSPNRYYPFETHGYDSPRTGNRIAPIRTFGLPWLPLALVHRVVRPWARNYWPRALRRLVRDAGFEIVATTYLWQTFENISGRQPAAVRLLRPALRAIASGLEHTPGLRAFGVSQAIVATRAH